VRCGRCSCLLQIRYFLVRAAHVPPMHPPCSLHQSCAPAARTRENVAPPAGGGCWCGPSQQTANNFWRAPAAAPCRSQPEFGSIMQGWTEPFFLKVPQMSPMHPCCHVSVGLISPAKPGAGPRCLLVRSFRVSRRASPGHILEICPRLSAVTCLASLQQCRAPRLRVHLPPRTHAVTLDVRK
jgi:hypothetical protein